MKHVFCIGFNKTATTSLLYLFSQKMLCGKQSKFEQLIYDYYNQNYDSILREINLYSQRDTFFQDVPFSMPNFYKVIDKNFPKSKFILSVRDSEDEWYSSLRRFHNVNSTKELRNVHLGLSKNWLYDWYVRGLGCHKNDPLNEKYLKSAYSLHIKNANEYFFNSKRFLQINIKDQNLLKKLTDFTGINFLDCKIPHVNQSTS